MAYRVNYFSKTKSKNKYNAKKQEYGGVKYDSKFEAKYAEDLDWRLKVGEIVDIKRQVKIPIVVKGVLIANYYCDFRESYQTERYSTTKSRGSKCPYGK